MTEHEGQDLAELVRQLDDMMGDDPVGFLFKVARLMAASRAVDSTYFKISEWDVKYIWELTSALHQFREIGR